MEAANFKGSIQERQAVVMCRQLGIDDTKLTPEGFQLLIKVLAKSRHLNIPRSRRRRSGNKLVMLGLI